LIRLFFFLALYLHYFEFFDGFCGMRALGQNQLTRLALPLPLPLPLSRSKNDLDLQVPPESAGSTKTLKNPYFTAQFEAKPLDTHGEIKMSNRLFFTLILTFFFIQTSVAIDFDLSTPIIEEIDHYNSNQAIDSIKSYAESQRGTVLSVATEASNLSKVVPIITLLPTLEEVYTKFSPVVSLINKIENQEDADNAISSAELLINALVPSYFNFSEAGSEVEKGLSYVINSIGTLSKENIPEPTNDDYLGAILSPDVRSFIQSNTIPELKESLNGHFKLSEDFTNIYEETLNGIDTINKAINEMEKTAQLVSKFSSALSSSNCIFPGCAEIYVSLLARRLDLTNGISELYDIKEKADNLLSYLVTAEEKLLNNTISLKDSILNFESAVSQPLAISKWKTSGKFNGNNGFIDDLGFFLTFDGDSFETQGINLPSTFFVGNLGFGNKIHPYDSGIVDQISFEIFLDRELHFGDGTYITASTSGLFPIKYFTTSNLYDENGVIDQEISADIIQLEGLPNGAKVWEESTGFFSLTGSLNSPLKLVDIEPLPGQNNVKLVPIGPPNLPPDATLLNYLIEGNGSGLLGDMSFTNTNFSISMIGAPALFNGSTISPLHTVSVTIDGIGTTTLNIPIELSSYEEILYGTDFSFISISNIIGYGILLGFYHSIVDLTKPFDAYYPWSDNIVERTDLIILDQLYSGNTVSTTTGNNVSTTMGPLSFSSMSGISFQANIVSSVPEPTTLALFGLGLAGLGYRRWRKG